VASTRKAKGSGEPGSAGFLRALADALAALSEAGAPAGGPAVALLARLARFAVLTRSRLFERMRERLRSGSYAGVPLPDRFSPEHFPSEWRRPGDPEGFAELYERARHDPEARIELADAHAHLSAAMDAGAHPELHDLLRRALRAGRYREAAAASHALLAVARSGASGAGSLLAPYDAAIRAAGGEALRKRLADDLTALLELLTEEVLEDPVLEDALEEIG
jgi:hypothetical protein